MDQNHVTTEEMMNTRMQKSPKILRKYAGKKSCCIFRVPQSLADSSNKKAYEPQIVSIGPYHHGDKDLEMIQEHKWRFLNGFIARTGKSLGFFLNVILSMEYEIRESYSESIEHVGSNDLAEMMVLDGVFLIELFRKVGMLIPIDQDDPIFSMLWVPPLLKRDLLKIENQIPFFGNIYLTFFRASFIKTRDGNPVAIKGNEILEHEPYLKLIASATNLDHFGVLLKANDRVDSFLDIKFQRGILLIPQINMDGFFIAFLFNGVAFEQCHVNCSKDITTYFVFLGCLINNSTDLDMLSQTKIIKNCFGEDKEVVKFFNSVGKDLVIDINDNYLKSLFVNVKKYCLIPFHSIRGDVRKMFRDLHTSMIVPPSLTEINKKEYQPQIVSIGPYHHGNKDLEMIQEHKWRFLDGFIARTGKSLCFFLNIVVSMENEIRQSYSESIEHVGSNDLAEMMVLDGVFLIELFRKVGRLIPIDQDDPIFSMVWVTTFLRRDLLKLENQIPFFVLQKLFDESTIGTRTLTSLILEFFNYAVDRSTSVLQPFNNLEGQHLLDLFRKSFINTNRNPVALRGNDLSDKSYLKLIEPATNLDFVGIKFKANHDADSFLDVNFRSGVLSIPQNNIDGFFTCFLLNSVAFEQCYFSCSKDITTYVMFLGCLINNSTDVGLLSQRKIIKNYFGTDVKLVKFFNNIRKDLTFDIKDNYLKGLFMEVNEYCSRTWRETFAGIERRYFAASYLHPPISPNHSIQNIPKNMNEIHVITEEKMRAQMQKSSKLLHKFAGRESCCIFRVPPNLAQINKEAYKPRIVSIGPYHHGNKDLEMIQEHKWRFLDGFIARTGNSLVVLLNLIGSMENRIRQSYSESIEHIGSNDLAEMMVLDGVFLIELFQKVGKLVPFDQADPIYRMVWVHTLLRSDLLKLENQIPFFVLQALFDVSRTDTRTLPSLILEFFNFAIDRPTLVLQRFNNLEGQHLLDLFRKSFINTNRNPVALRGNDMSDTRYLRLIDTASVLLVFGVNFKARHNTSSFLDVNLRSSALSIPRINMDGFFTCFILNGVAFEQCYFYCSKDFTTYVVFLSCLINNSTDVGLLSENRIIKNCFGTDEELAKFFNSFRKDLTFDIKDNYLKGLFKEVNECSSYLFRRQFQARTRKGFRENPHSCIMMVIAFLALYFAIVVHIKLPKSLSF
ncbi:hypothetical protein OSB04_009364 [Centaurea solstitialis]|uniref:Uncharacterized protein n=1 Tax=Centaurea solstitialis TaxID=347529 RepID=A0AA38WJM7_9ASTR|nr:hypothetical protein OSB04_009364 [Centaurea solstitialis]